MFIVSVKTDYKQVLSALGCIAVLVVAVVGAGLLPNRDVAQTSGRVTNGEERIAYLRSLGFEIAEAEEAVREVRIPDEADEVFSEYNALQEQVGRSLEAYSGKRVRLYTYQLTDGATAHLYVYRDRVIAGDVERDGTMQVIS